MSKVVFTTLQFETMKNHLKSKNFLPIMQLIGYIKVVWMREGENHAKNTEGILRKNCLIFKKTCNVKCQM